MTGREAVIPGQRAVGRALATVARRLAPIPRARVRSERLDEALRKKVTGHEPNRHSRSAPSCLRRKSRMAAGQARDQDPRHCWGHLRVGPAGGRSTSHDASRRLARLGGDRAPGRRRRRSNRGGGLGRGVYGLRARPFVGGGRGVVGLSYRARRPIVRAGVYPGLGDTAEVGEEREQGRRQKVTNRTPQNEQSELGAAVGTQTAISSRLIKLTAWNRNQAVRMFE